jgi:uncharacterized protein YndB with AHSA1/START domain
MSNLHAAVGTSGSPAVVPIEKTVVVTRSAENAFRVFTEEMGTWWPLATHHIGKVDAETVVIEPFVGGRWFERGIDGTECEWGRVRTWDPPRRLVLTWEISSHWRHDPSIQTELEVRFTAEGASTRVQLEHRLLHAYGDKASEMRTIFDSPRGWTMLLEAFASRATER